MDVLEQADCDARTSLDPGERVGRRLDVVQDFSQLLGL